MSPSDDSAIFALSISCICDWSRDLLRLIFGSVCKNVILIFWRHTSCLLSWRSLAPKSKVIVEETIGEWSVSKYRSVDRAAQDRTSARYVSVNNRRICHLSGRAEKRRWNVKRNSTLRKTACFTDTSDQYTLVYFWVTNFHVVASAREMSTLIVDFSRSMSSFWRVLFVAALLLCLARSSLTCPENCLCYRTHAGPTVRCNHHSLSRIPNVPASTVVL